MTPYRANATLSLSLASMRQWQACFLENLRGARDLPLPPLLSGQVNLEENEP